MALAFFVNITVVDTNQNGLDSGELELLAAGTDEVFLKIPISSGEAQREVSEEELMAFFGRVVNRFYLRVAEWVQHPTQQRLFRAVWLDTERDDPADYALNNAPLADGSYDLVSQAEFALMTVGRYSTVELIDPTQIPHVSVFTKEGDPIEVTSDGVGILRHEIRVGLSQFVLRETQTGEAGQFNATVSPDVPHGLDNAVTQVEFPIPIQQVVTLLRSDGQPVLEGTAVELYDDENLNRGAFRSELTNSSGSVTFTFYRSDLLRFFGRIPNRFVFRAFERNGRLIHDSKADPREATLPAWFNDGVIELDRFGETPLTLESGRVVFDLTVLEAQSFAAVHPATLVLFRHFGGTRVELDRVALDDAGRGSLLVDDETTQSAGETFEVELRRPSVAPKRLIPDFDLASTSAFAPSVQSRTVLVGSEEVEVSGTVRDAANGDVLLQNFGMTITPGATLGSGSQTVFTDSNGRFRIVLPEATETSINVTPISGVPIRIGTSGAVSSSAAGTVSPFDSAPIQLEVDGSSVELRTFTWDRVGKLVLPTADPTGRTVNIFADTGAGQTKVATALTGTDGYFSFQWVDTPPHIAGYDEAARQVEFRVESLPDATASGPLEAHPVPKTLDFGSDTVVELRPNADPLLAGSWNPTLSDVFEGQPANPYASLASLPPSPTAQDVIDAHVDFRHGLVQARLTETAATLAHGSSRYQAGRYTLSPIAFDPATDDIEQTLQAYPYSDACACDPCESSLGPLAYLIALLSWGSKRLSITTGSGSFVAQLSQALSQPIDAFRNDCDSLREEIPQVRIAVEVLRAKLAEEGVSPTGGIIEDDERVIAARKGIYLAILRQLGTSYEELVRLYGGNADTVTPNLLERRRGLSERLAIPEADLATFRLDLVTNDRSAPLAVTEEKLEELFGYRATVLSTGLPDPFAAIDSSTWETKRQEYLRQRWATLDRPPETSGIEPLVDPGKCFSAECVSTKTSYLYEQRLGAIQAKLGQMFFAYTGATDDGAAFADTIAASGLFDAPPSGSTATSPTPQDNYEDVRQRWQQGDTGIQDELMEERGLLPREFAAVVAFEDRLGASSPTDSERDGLFGALSAGFRRSQFAVWVDEEASATEPSGVSGVVPEPVVLSPEHFAVSNASFFAGRDVVDYVGSTPEERERWKATLQERTQVWNAAPDLKAVAKAEEFALPVLRDALLEILGEQTSQTFPNLSELADWASEQYVLDFQMDGCAKTTRLGQAVLTLQKLFERARNQTVGAFSQNSVSSSVDVTLDIWDFDEAWVWLGDFERWRVATTIFTYPHAFLDVAPRRGESGAFRKLRRLLADQPTLSVQGIDALAQDFYHEARRLSTDSRFIKAGILLEQYPWNGKMVLVGGRTRSSFSVVDTRVGTQQPWAKIEGIDGADCIGLAEVRKKVWGLFGERSLQLLGFDPDRGWEQTPEELEFEYFDAERTGVGFSAGFKPKLVTATAIRGGGLEMHVHAVSTSGVAEESKRFGTLLLPTMVSGDGAIVDRTDDFLPRPEVLGAAEATNGRGLLAVVKYGATAHVLFLLDGVIWKRGKFPANLFATVLSLEEPVAVAVETDPYFPWFKGYSVSGTSFTIGPVHWLAERFVCVGGYGELPSEGGQSTSEGGWFLGRDSDGSYFISPFAYDNSGGGLAVGLSPDVNTVSSPSVRFPLRRDATKAELTESRSILQQEINTVVGQGYPSAAAPLRELSFFAPILFSDHCLENGNFREAADWLRLVYDWSLPATKQAIYPGVSSDAGGDVVPDSVEEFVSDPINPHGLAGFDPTVYRRWILSKAVHLMIEWARDRFAKDTSLSRANAVDLLEVAETILQDPLVSPATGGDCSFDELINDLKPIVYSPGDSKDDEAAWLARIGESWDAMNSRVWRILARTEALSAAGDPALSTANARWEAAAIEVEEAYVNGSSNYVDSLARRKSVSDLLGHLESTGDFALGEVAAQIANDGLFRDALATTQVAVSTDFVRGIGAIPGATTDPAVLQFSDTDVPIGDGVYGQAAFNVDAGELDNFQNPEFGKFVKGYIPGTGVLFCAPNDPSLDSYRLQVMDLLWKLRHCRTITGDPAPTRPTVMYEAVDIGDLIAQAETVAAQGGFSEVPQTQLRLEVLVAEAQRLANAAAQAESGLLQALGNRDAESYSRLRARQVLEGARVGTMIAERQLSVAWKGREVINRQIAKAKYLEWAYRQLQDEYPNGLEDAALWTQRIGAIANAVSTLGVIGSALVNPAQTMAIAPAVSGLTSSLSSALLLESSFELRDRQWGIQESSFKSDKRISEAQLAVQDGQVEVAQGQKRAAQLREDHAKKEVDFLSAKTLDLDLYRALVRVLRRAYRLVLTEAVAVAKLAEAQLNFEYPGARVSVLRDRYWIDESGDLATTETAGLTGSARLKADLERLISEERSLKTRRVFVTKRLSLNQYAPEQLVRLRQGESATLDLNLDWFERDHPGLFHQRIEHVSVSMAALSPSPEGVHAILTSNGRGELAGIDGSRIEIRRPPQVIGLDAAIGDDGLSRFEPQNELLRPFEGVGIATSLTLKMPQASNFWDLSTIADVVFEIEYSAEFDEGKYATTAKSLPTSTQASCSFSMLSDFPDAWFTLVDAAKEGVATLPSLRFELERSDFPYGVRDIVLEELSLIAMTEGGERIGDFPIEFGTYDPSAPQNPGTVSPGELKFGLASSIRGNDVFTAVLGDPVDDNSPVSLELGFPDPQEGVSALIGLLADESVADIVFIVEYACRLPSHPAGSSV